MTLLYKGCWKPPFIPFPQTPWCSWSLKMVGDLVYPKLPYGHFREHLSCSSPIACHLPLMGSFSLRLMSPPWLFNWIPTSTWRLQPQAIQKYLCYTTDWNTHTSDCLISVLEMWCEACWPLTVIKAPMTLFARAEGTINSRILAMLQFG